MTAKPLWAEEGRDWPNRETSRFVEAAGLIWHVQEQGAGPVLLLLHGTAAATHSWRDLAPLLAKRFRVIAPDLPGHGFTQTPSDHGFHLPAMAGEVAALMTALGVEPDWIVGHSAGAAIAIRMALDGLAQPRRIIGLNAALLPFPGAAGTLFPQLARLLFLNPFAPGLFAWRARESAAVPRLLRGVGSALDPRGIDLYARLLRTPGHIDGALKMMAHWDLATLAADLPKLATPLTLVTGLNDRAVPPAQAREVARHAAGVQVVDLPGLGHLAHEEAPQQIARLIADLAADDRNRPAATA